MHGNGEKTEDKVEEVKLKGTERKGMETSATREEKKRGGEKVKAWIDIEYSMRP